MNKSFNTISCTATKERETIFCTATKEREESQLSMKIIGLKHKMKKEINLDVTEASQLCCIVQRCSKSSIYK